MLGSPYLSSPDMQSAVFPDRLIRPLPRRSLRSRLSEEAAEAISYPPNPHTANLPQYEHYAEQGKRVDDSTVVIQSEGAYYDRTSPSDPHARQWPQLHRIGRGPEKLSYHHGQIREDELESGEEEDYLETPMHRSRNCGSRLQSSRSSRSSRHNPSRSNCSALDGYDAFENTNNKKKRKVPTHGNIGFHQSSLSAELAYLGLSSSATEELAVARDDGNTRGAYQAPTPSANNHPASVSRPHQARELDRRGDGRSPLGLSSVNPAIRSSNAGLETGDSSSLGRRTMSMAYTNGTSKTGNSTHTGQENAGLLGQGSRSPPANTKFTFTYETEAAKGVSFPEQSLYSASYGQRGNQVPTAASGNGRIYPGREASRSADLEPHDGAYPRADDSHPVGHSNNPGPKPRRRRADLYALSARQRRLQQEYTNLHQPPAPEDIWICEFCEYESIFGVPPMALIRQYEIKDRKERKRLAEKRRLLEKAKMKSRKGKKQTKQAAKSANGVQPQALNHHSYDQQQNLDQLGPDDYLDDGYEEDTVPLATTPLSTVRQPMPGAYEATKTKYPVTGGSGNEARSEWHDGPS